MIKSPLSTRKCSARKGWGDATEISLGVLKSRAFRGQFLRTFLKACFSIGIDESELL